MDYKTSIDKLQSAAIAAFGDNNIDIANMSFFEFLDLCKEKDPEIAIAFDLKPEWNIAESLFYALSQEWLSAYDTSVFCHGFAAESYMLIYHLFAEEDFMEMFKDNSHLMSAILYLSRNEVDLCKFTDSSGFAQLYDLIAKRTVIAMKSKSE